MLVVGVTANCSFSKFTSLPLPLTRERERRAEKQRVKSRRRRKRNRRKATNEAWHTSLPTQLLQAPPVVEIGEEP